MKIFCSGIGGIGLSAYAAYQNAAGHTVLGSDRSMSPLLEDLQSQGITIILNQDGSGIPDDIDLFVYSEAVAPTSGDRIRATALGVKQLTYFQGLGEISKDHRLIGISGSHGKSSTTAMVARMLLLLHQDPSIIVGTKLKELDGRNWRKGGSHIFAAEACEYKGQFRSLDTKILLITNVEWDHVDAFPTPESYSDMYVEYLNMLGPDLVIIAHGSDAASVEVIQRANRTFIDADTQPLLTLATPGLHMQKNAQLVLALADHLKLDHAKVAEALSGFSGSWRRMELKGETIHNVPVYDDYGHHPTEVQVTLKGLRDKYPNNRLICVFQPHMHNRTLALYDEFTKAFSSVDLVVIPNIYDARGFVEHDKVEVKKLVADIARISGVEAIDGISLQETERMLKESILKEGDVLICMGAGDITNLATKLVSA